MNKFIIMDLNPFIMKQIIFNWGFTSILLSKWICILKNDFFHHSENYFNHDHLFECDFKFRKKNFNFKNLVSSNSKLNTLFLPEFNEITSEFIFHFKHI